MQVELESKKTGERKQVLAVFNERDHLLEVRPPHVYPITRQLDRKDVPKFLAGQQVSMSYVYLVRLVAQ